MTPKELNLSVSDDNLNFKEFSKQPEYVEVNRGLIQKLVSQLPAVFCHVDVATGTGLVPRLIKEEATEENKEGEVIGLDPNVTSLNIAGRNILGSRGISVKFIEGMGQDLKQLLNGIIPPGGVDGVSILDALHEIRKDEDKVEVIGAMAEILKTGGLLAFNSAFTTEAISIDPMSWGKLKLRAMGMLGRKRDKQIQGLLIHPPWKYKQMIENAGLEVIYEAKKTVNLTREALLAISKYPPFFRGALEDMRGQEGFSDIEKSSALVRAVKELGVLGVLVFPRVWCEIIARKPYTLDKTLQRSGIIYERSEK